MVCTWLAHKPQLKIQGGKTVSFKSWRPMTQSTVTSLIITAAYEGDLKIWSKTSQELITQYLNYTYPIIVSDNQAQLIVFSYLDDSIDNMTTFNFGASHTDTETDN